MRKTCMLLGVLLMMFVVSGVQKSHAAREQASLPAAKPLPPDLTCTVKFVHIEEYKNANGVSCYSPRPYFTITNKGKSEAKDFVYIIEWNAGPGHTWQTYTLSNPTISLKPGATVPINGGGPSWDHFWCADEPDWKPGWRIRVDTTNVVQESNENNNMATEFYTPTLIPKMKPPRAINKGIQNPVTPQTNTAPIHQTTPAQIK